MTQKTATVTSTPKDELSDAPCGVPPNLCGSYWMILSNQKAVFQKVRMQLGPTRASASVSDCVSYFLGYESLLCNQN